MQYVSILNTPANAILAARMNGSLIPWRIDAAGVRWYKSQPAIHGVPKDEPIHADLIEEEDDDDTGCEMIIADDNGEMMILAEDDDDNGECEMIGEDD